MQCKDSVGDRSDCIGSYCTFALWLAHSALWHTRLVIAESYLAVWLPAVNALLGGDNRRGNRFDLFDFAC